MDKNDREAIEGLFDRLARVERDAPARDGAAELLIAEAVTRQPGAPYYMAQTVIVQDHALNRAQERIEQLEAELDRARQAQGGGFLSGLFGADPVPGARARPPQPMPQGASGGFLAGAAQTAMGVAGGVLLANALAGAFAGEAEAGEALPEEDPGLGDGGFDGDFDL